MGQKRKMNDENLDLLLMESCRGPRELCRPPDPWWRRLAGQSNASKRHLIIMSTFVDVPEIKLIRTDTTLDLSQKAEKVCLIRAPKIAYVACRWNSHLTIRKFSGALHEHVRFEHTWKKMHTEFCRKTKMICFKVISQTWWRSFIDKSHPKRRKSGPRGSSCVIRPLQALTETRSASPDFEKTSWSRDLQVFSKLVESAFSVSRICFYSVRG